MNRYKKRTQARLITAIALIAGSFLSAFVLSALANRTELMWAARVPLIPGHIISANELETYRAALPDTGGRYLLASQNIAGSIVLRNVGAGELLPAISVSRDLQALRRSSLPISVHASDVPGDLQAGEIVNLYHVGDSRLTEDFGPPRNLLSHIYVLGIDRKSQNLGGDLAMTLSVNVKNVLDVLGATAAGRIVVVRVNG